MRPRPRRRKPSQAGYQKVVDMATAVIIPARNEQQTVGSVVSAFQHHPETKNNVYVGIDAMTDDRTAEFARKSGGIVVQCTDIHGKGEVVAHVTGAMRILGVVTDRVILCDADYRGLRQKHITSLLTERRGMVIGVPDFPDIDEVPTHVSRAWPLVSGFRYLPEKLIPEDAHGYLLETQLNQASRAAGMDLWTIPMPGLKSPFRWPLSPRRMAALQRDRAWGIMHGVF
jgi:glycosyltransferase involved in cell wall biosynthesis